MPTHQRWSGDERLSVGLDGATTSRHFIEENHVAGRCSDLCRFSICRLAWCEPYPSSTFAALCALAPRIPGAVRNASSCVRYLMLRRATVHYDGLQCSIISLQLSSRSAPSSGIRRRPEVTSCASESFRRSFLLTVAWSSVSLWVATSIERRGALHSAIACSASIATRSSSSALHRNGRR